MEALQHTAHSHFFRWIFHLLPFSLMSFNVCFTEWWKNFPRAWVLKTLNWFYVKYELVKALSKFVWFIQETSQLKSIRWEKKNVNLILRYLRIFLEKFKLYFRILFRGFHKKKLEIKDCSKMTSDFWRGIEKFCSFTIKKPEKRARGENSNDVIFEEPLKRRVLPQEKNVSCL